MTLEDCEMGLMMIAGGAAAWSGLCRAARLEGRDAPRMVVLINAAFGSSGLALLLLPLAYAAWLPLAEVIFIISTALLHIALGVIEWRADLEADRMQK